MDGFAALVLLLVVAAGLALAWPQLLTFVMPNRNRAARLFSPRPVEDLFSPLELPSPDPPPMLAAHQPRAPKATNGAVFVPGKPTTQYRCFRTGRLAAECACAAHKSA